MKKILLLSVVFLFVFAQSQEKRIDFTKKIQYKNIGKKNSPVNKNVLMMNANTNGEFLSQIDVNSFPVQIYTDQLGTTPVSIKLNNKLEGSFSSFFFRSMDMEQDKKLGKIQKLNVKETILGYPCEQYLITYKNDGSTEQDGNDYSERNNLKFCIDTKSPYNNFSVLKGIMHVIGFQKIEQNDLKGLILKAGPQNNYDSEHIILSSITDQNEFVVFNHRDAMMKQQKQYDSLLIERKKWEQEFDDEVMVDSAVAVSDSAYAFNDGDLMIEEYTSEYKTYDEEPNYAVQSLSTEKLWNAVPKHCKNFEKNVPALQNKAFQKSLTNYVGQMCDMYLTTSAPSEVAIKLTLDQIRKEILYMNRNKEKLNSSDRKKVDDYLDQLD